MTMPQFEALVEQARRRMAWLADFDRLAAATAKLRKVEAAAATERQKFEAMHAAFIDKMTAFDAEAEGHRDTVSRGESARGNLLDPDMVPGTIGQRYREALAESDAATAAVENAQREVREQKIGRSHV